MAINSLAAVLCGTALTLSAATTRTWTGDNNTPYWSDTLNWNPTGAPAPGDSLVIPAGYSTVNNLSGLEVFSLQFTGNGSSTVSGNAILLDSDITSSQSGTTRISLQTITWNRGGGTIYALGTGLLNIESDLFGSGQAQLILYPFYTNALGTNLLLQGSIEGAIDLVKFGDGVALLTGSSANTYSGGTFVRGGTLYLSKTGVTAISSKVVIGDTGEFSTLVDESTGNYPAALDMTVGPFGEWLLNESATVTNLMMFTPTSAGNPFAGSINGNGFLSLECDVTVTNLGNPYYAGGISCTILLGAQTRAFHIPDNFDLTNLFQNYFEVGILIGTGSAGIIKDGFGTLGLTKPNNYPGTTLLEQGTLAVQNNSALSGAQTIIHYNTLELDGVTTAEPIIFDGGIFDGISFYGSNVLTGPLTLTTSPNLYSGYSEAFLALNGVVSGPGALGVGPGIVRLGGTSPNTFTGGAYVESFLGNLPYLGGTLQLAKPDNVVAVPGFIEVTSYGTNNLQSLQDNGLQNVQLDSQSRWLLGGHSVAPQSLTIEGNAVIDTQGGQLQLTSSPGTNWFYVIPNTNIYAPASNFTAQIIGTLACLAPTNGLFIDAGLTLNVSAQTLGAGMLLKTGSGTLDLSGTYNATGPLLAAEGLTIDDGPQALGNPTVVSDGATLLINGTNVTSCTATLNLAGDGIGDTNGALTCFLNPYITGGIVLAAPSTINTPAAANLNVQSVISGTGPLTKSGAGTLILSGTSANTFSGDTVVDVGLLSLSKASSTPGNLVVGIFSPLGFPGPSVTARLFVNNGVGGTNVTVNSDSLFDLNNQNQNLVSVNLNGGGSIQTGSGVLDFTGAIGTGARVTVDPGRSGASVISGNIFIYFGGTLSVGLQSFPDLLHPAPPLDIQATLGDVFSSSLIKNGSGEMRLSGANTFSSTLSINEGTVSVANSLGLGSTSAGTVVNSNAALLLEPNLTIANESLTLSSTNANALYSPGGSNVWNGPISLNQIAGIDVGSGYLQILGAVAGSGGLVKSGGGTLQFGGALANTYTGLTTVSQGMLEAGRVGVISIPGDAVVGDDTTNVTVATVQLDRDQQVMPRANVTVHDSGYLHLYDFPSAPAPNPRVRTLSGGGVVAIDPLAMLTVSNDVACTFSGALNGGQFFSTNIFFLKTGVGTMKLNGGGALIGRAVDAAGELQVNGFFSEMAMDVKSGARLRGGGVLNGAIVESGGVLGAGSATPDKQGGVFSPESVQLTNGTTLQLNFYGPSATGGNDEISSVSAPTISNATLSPAFFYPPHDGDVLTLMHNSVNNAASGTFTGWPAGQQKLVGTVPVVISYSGGAGSDITLTVTNLALTYSSYRLAEGNGNQTVEPNECNLLYLTLHNRRPNSVTITNALLYSLSTNAVVTIASATYPVIGAGLNATNLTPFQFRTDTNLACGTAVTFELVLGVVNEGQFAVDFTPAAGADCSHPTGPCASCTVVSGQFTAGTPMTSQPLYFVGGPSICYPPKACPGSDLAPNLPPFAYIIHSFTNATTNNVCVTAQLDLSCGSPDTNALGVAAYVGQFNTNAPCAGYLGDSGASGPPYPAFSFQVPASSNFVVVVMSRTTNLVCDSYALELFGLPCPPPTLAIEADITPGKVRVDWSTAYPGWTAQQLGTLSGNFSNVVQTPAIVNGRYALTNITTITNEFYRLQK